MSAVIDVPSQQEREQRIHELGSALWKTLQHRKPSIFERRWLEERLLTWALSDESIKVQLFRFLDVLPSLRDHVAINQHLNEFFEDIRAHLPNATRLGLELTDNNSILSRALAFNVRTNASRMARRFIAGSTLLEVEQTLKNLRDKGYAITVDQLSSCSLTEEEAHTYQTHCIDLLNHLCHDFERFPEAPQIDADDLGSIPRVNISIKLSSLDPNFSPLDAEGTSERVKDKLRPIFDRAIALDAFINFDMEETSHKHLTISIFKQLLEEEEYRDFPNFGITIQAYLLSSSDDLEDLLAWTKNRGTPITVRLVKGDYWNHETTLAAQRGWPSPVFTQKWQTDTNYEALTHFLLDNRDWLKPAFASHNLRSLTHAIAYAEQHDIPQSAYELQLLYGVGDEFGQALVEKGYRVRIDAPYGQLIPGIAYLVRRLLENTSNDSYLKHSNKADIPPEVLFQAPAPTESSTSTSTPGHNESSKPSFGINSQVNPDMLSTVSDPQKLTFTNTPLTDFSLEANRDRMKKALSDVRDQFGNDYSLIIDGKSYETRNQWTTVCPFDKNLTLGRISLANSDHVTDAVEAAKRSFVTWSTMEPDYRAEYLDLIGSQLEKRRFDLAAWMVYEIGKTWKEADADVAEAIDFCHYYAVQMRQIAREYAHNFPGEDNSLLFRPKGVSVIIAPWNFPLAILTGMAAAALVTGNTVIMKPAEQGFIVAAKLMEIINDIGLPEGVINFVPGTEEVIPELVGSPNVDLIAFTGTQDLGLEIVKQASDTNRRQRSVKKVIAEMGGKNSIIIDTDADLDEAIAGVIESVFSYSGQKSAACSRIIVLDSVYDTFTKRLSGTIDRLKVGPSDDPGTNIGPVIDARAMTRLEEAITRGRENYPVLISLDVTDLKEKGHYVSPTIFTEVPPDDALAQDELFGPVAVILKAKNFDEALKLANNTRYALTGGVYSRSPANLQKARREFDVGNLYLNRPITSAIVDRQPFGGFRMSGIGSKPGGPDYLWQFMTSRTITENTTRQGLPS